MANTSTSTAPMHLSYELVIEFTNYLQS